jgi:hypothetical protein
MNSMVVIRIREPLKLGGWRREKRREISAVLAEPVAK